MNFWLQILMLLGGLIIGVGLMFMLHLLVHGGNAREAFKDFTDGSIKDVSREKTERMKLTDAAIKAGERAKPKNNAKINNDKNIQ